MEIKIPHSLKKDFCCCMKTQLEDEIITEMYWHCCCYDLVRDPVLVWFRNIVKGCWYYKNKKPTWWLKTV